MSTATASPSQNATSNPNQALWEKGDFTRIAATMRESGEALVERIGITKGLKVLDLGCGDGTTAIPAAKPSPTTTNRVVSSLVCARAGPPANTASASRTANSSLIVELLSRMALFQPHISGFRTSTPGSSGAFSERARSAFSSSGPTGPRKPMMSQPVLGVLPSTC